MLGEIWGRAAAPPKRIVREIVERAYREAGERDCCDPCDLAYGLFRLRPCPTRTEIAFIRDDVLHYPEDATLSLRGLAVQRLIAKRLWPRYEGTLRGQDLPPARPADLVRLMIELILPERAARSVSFGDLAQLQPHAPLGLVQAIYMSHGRSGIIRVPRGLR